MATQQGQASQRQSFLIAAIGSTTAVLAQCFAATAEEAGKAVKALFVDKFGEEPEVKAIDTDARAGLWIEGNPAYVKSVIAYADDQQAQKDIQAFVDAHEAEAPDVVG